MPPLNLGTNGLSRVFNAYHPEPVAAMAQFRANLVRLGLPFDPLGGLRMLEYPGYGACEGHAAFAGMPPSFYYFVPGSGWGSDGAPLVHPLDVNFPYRADGIGLNLGCPLRLARALEILYALDPSVQNDVIPALKNPSQHLPTVEELLWLDACRHDGGIRRGRLVGNKSVDWEFISQGVEVMLEVKARGATWPLHSDGAAFTPQPGCFLEKAYEKFPVDGTVDLLRVVAITGQTLVDAYFKSYLKSDLISFPNIDVVVYRHVIGPIYVFSLNEEHMRAASLRIRPFAPWGCQVHSIFVFHREARDERIATVNHTRTVPEVRMHEAVLVAPSIDLEPPAAPYRVEIPTRGASGEPIFEVITPCQPL